MDHVNGEERRRRQCSRTGHNAQAPPVSIIMVAGRRVFPSGVHPQRGDNMESSISKVEYGSLNGRKRRGTVAQLPSRRQMRADVLRPLAVCRTEVSALRMDTLGLRLF